MSNIRHDWSEAEVSALFRQPFNELLFKSHTIHRQNFDPNAVQISTLLSIKTGACPEDCSYCSQSGHHNTGLKKEKLMDVDSIMENARQAKKGGATRYCMGAAWRRIPKGQLPKVIEILKQVKALGMETCMTLGMLDADEADALAEAGLDYYNHNLDTSPEYYKKIITTRCYQDRLDTLENVRRSGMKVCCGGILGLGESREDRVALLCQLANLPEHPQSVPINQLVRIKGTPLENEAPIDNIEFIRSIAVARIMMPKAMVRLSAGREAMSDEMQALCFFAGANSIFYGEKLLTTANPETHRDLQLFDQLGLKRMELTTDAVNP